MALDHELKQLHQQAARARGKGGAALGPCGHRLARRVHPGRKRRVFGQLGHRAALKHAEVHLAQVLQFDGAHARVQDLGRLHGAQQRRGEHHPGRRVGELFGQGLQLGAAFAAQRQVGAAADVAAFQVAPGQAVADQVELEILQWTSSLRRARPPYPAKIHDNLVTILALPYHR